MAKRAAMMQAVPMTAVARNLGRERKQVGRRARLTLRLFGTSADQTLGFTYNPAGQIGSRAASNDAYAWLGAVNVDRLYATNGLNQYTASGTTSLGYDGRGNLTASGGTSYGYTSDNRLATATGIVGLYYDPLDRLFNINAEAGTNISAMFDGSDIIAEVDHVTLTTLRRYVFGPGTDEPLVWYEGAGTTDRRWLVADERGSVVAVTDGSGNALTITKLFVAMYLAELGLRFSKGISVWFVTKKQLISNLQWHFGYYS